MADDPAVPPASEPASGTPPEPDSRSGEVERFGIVSIARHRKDDGRMLLLYVHDPAETP
jgi:hypothetical protein